jgi:hypothetical protein
MESKSIPSNIKTAARRFRKERVDYYKYLASMLESSKGQTKFETLFERDAQRYDGKPRGILAAYWYSEYQQNGANLSSALEGTLPTDEVAVLRVAEAASDGAISSALRDVSRIAALSDRLRKETISTLGAAVGGLVLAILMLTIFPVFSSRKLIEMYSFIPLDAWGSRGKAFNNYAEWIASFGLYVVVFLSLIIFFVVWTFENLIGPTRDWLDKNISVYKCLRDVKGALFLSTMSTLTRRRGGGMQTLTDSLHTFILSIRSPWLKWRVEEVVSNIEVTGATGSDSFKTNLLSEEMFFFLRDTQEARDFASGFQETGAYVETVLIETIIKRLGLYKWGILMVGVITVIAVLGWQSSVIGEMKGVMTNYYSSQ